MRFRRFIAAASIVALFLMAGCVHGEIKVAMNADRTGDVAVTLVMEKQALDQLKQLGTTEPFEKARRDFRAKGYAISNATTKDGSGFVAKKRVGDITGDALADTITEAMRTAEQTATPTSKPASGKVVVALGLKSDEWTTDLAVPGLSGDLSSYDLAVALVMPGTLASSNADDDTTQTSVLRWKLKSSETTFIKAESNVDQTARVVVALLVALGVIGAGIGGVLLLRRNGATAPVQPLGAESDAPDPIAAPVASPEASATPVADIPSDARRPPD
jgi:hypothetical protein